MCVCVCIGRLDGLAQQRPRRVIHPVQQEKFAIFQYTYNICKTIRAASRRRAQNPKYTRKALCGLCQQKQVRSVSPWRGDFETNSLDSREPRTRYILNGSLQPQDQRGVSHGHTHIKHYLPSHQTKKRGSKNPIRMYHCAHFVKQIFLLCPAFLLWKTDMKHAQCSCLTCQTLVLFWCQYSDIWNM